MGLPYQGGALYHTMAAIGRDTLIVGSTFGGMNQSGFYKTTDGGSSWAPSLVGSLPANPADARSIGILANRTLLVGVQRSDLPYAARSNDLGVTWTRSDAGLNAHPLALVQTPHGLVFAALSNGASISSDQGSSWTSISGALPAAEYRAIARTSNGRVFIGRFSVYEFNFSDSSWTPTGLQPIAINSLIASGNEQLFAATDHGIYTAILPTSGVSQHPISVDIPTSLSLSAYPNPFNPDTRILVSTQAPVLAAVYISDLLGRPIESLFHGVLQTGEKEFRWSPAARISGGVYFLSVRTATTATSKRILLLR
jgi:photosystem II stability/assembly factor-like uncharacterized protein